MMYRTQLDVSRPWWIETPTHIEVPWPQVARICGQPYGFDPSRDPCDPILAMDQDRKIYEALFAVTQYPWLNPFAPCPGDAWFYEDGWVVQKPKTLPRWNPRDGRLL